MLTTTRPTTPPAAATARAPRRGFTMGELVVALMLFSLVGGSILSLVMRQQRFYRSTADVIRVQGQLRQGASLLPIDLRTVSTSDTLSNSASTRLNADIYKRNDWSLEFRRTFGSSMVCARRAIAPLDTMTIFPAGLTATAALTNWVSQPQVGDSVLILDEWTMIGLNDDRWQAYEIRAVTPVKGVNGCPWKNLVAGDSTPLLYPADTVRTSYKIALDRDLPGSVLVGAPMRFFRRVRYEIYQAPDQLWYLGYSDCLPTYTTWNKCTEVTPVAGPYRPYTGISSENGLVFRYFDQNGNLLAASDPSRLVARVDVVMRGETQGLITRTGSGVGSTYRDSIMLSIGIRNRR